jgi:hypothetical protein
MVSQKNNSLKYCIKCKILLNNENWNSSRKKHGHYVCNICRKKQDDKNHQNDLKYGDKQLARYRSIRSTVIFFYGNKCAICGEEEYEKLTIDHIHGQGNQHRKEMTTNITDYLFNNKVNMEDYQVLCYNCNCSKNVLYKDKTNLKNKIKVVENYGGCCAECKEDRIERLTIDHKNNDGAEQRRQLKCSTGCGLYRWLIKNNYPTDLGLQILCYNCNCSKLYKNRKVLVLNGS